ncbi:calcium-binding protein [Hansschlegelia zhihuaiae]|uniref:Calcium-binding protein n=1 Tax=Hansschlegelia zhihuaiae TaxID=405005 RepID=A0A4Q0MJZ1_9HYPH|nr:hypothetical protein [Hansschlegelia zhihuaiae]RXF74041.1 hypothetical protein EK403_06615 [Hansschlegelia zhihuaiae]
MGYWDGNRYIGDASRETVVGGDAAEHISTADGGDWVDAGAGDDTVWGGWSRDTLDGGEGFDTLDYRDEPVPLQAVLRGPEDAVVFGMDPFDPDDIMYRIDRVINFENVIGSKYSDAFVGRIASNVFDGWLGNDTLTGYDGEDTLIGNYGADSLFGGYDDDTLVGSVADNTSYDPDMTGGAEASSDTLDGGNGIDTANYSDASTRVVVRLDGANLVLVKEEGAGVDSMMNVENVIGGAAGDRLTGDDLANALSGGLGSVPNRFAVWTAC